MKKRLTSILLTLCMVLTLLPTAVYAADTATPSDTKFVINGKSVSVTAAYVINNTNYLQLRAIAAMLNGTSAQFDISWDGQYAVIEPGKPYSGTITETKLQKTTDIRKSDTKFKMNGKVFTFTDARLINGGTNYIQLREFAQKLAGTSSQFNVYWDSSAGQAVIQPGVAYTGNPPQSASTTPTAKGGIKRTINMDNLLTLEISNSYAYVRTFGYDVEGAGYNHYLVVPEGTTIKCTKYVPITDSPGTSYSIAPYDVIYFESGAIWPSITYTNKNVTPETATLLEGGSVTLVNGNEYFYQTYTTDKSITSKYGKVSAVFYNLTVYVVPADVAAKIGGSAPKMANEKQTLQEFYVPSSAGSAPVTYIKNQDAVLLPYDGWYLLGINTGTSFALAINSKGNAEFNYDVDSVFYLQKEGNSKVTLRIADGRYLGIDGTAANGANVKLVKNPYYWNIYFENNRDFENWYSLRPSTNTGLVVSASGTIKKGSPVILSAQKSMDAPKNAELSFYPAAVPKSVAFAYTSSLPGDDGIYYIRASKDPQYVIQVYPNYNYLSEILRKQIGDKLHIYEMSDDNPQRFRITRVKDNQYTIQSVDSGKWWTSSGTKGSAVTHSDSEPTGNANLFTIIKQKDGTFRIMDSSGLYVAISNGDVDDYTHIILWTEASDGSQTFLFEKIK